MLTSLRDPEAESCARPSTVADALLLMTAMVQFLMMMMTMLMMTTKMCSEWQGACGCDDSAVSHVALIPLSSGVRHVVVVIVILTLALCRRSASRMIVITPHALVIVMVATAMRVSIGPWSGSGRRPVDEAGALCSQPHIEMRAPSGVFVKAAVEIPTAQPPEALATPPAARCPSSTLLPFFFLGFLIKTE